MGSSAKDDFSSRGAMAPQGPPVDQLQPAQKPVLPTSVLPGDPHAMATGLTPAMTAAFAKEAADQQGAVTAGFDGGSGGSGGSAAGQGAGLAGGGASDASDLPPLMQEAPASVQQQYRAAKQSGDAGAASRIMLAYLKAGGGGMTSSRGGGIADIVGAWPGGSSHEGSHAGHTFGGGLY